MKRNNLITKLAALMASTVLALGMLTGCSASSGQGGDNTQPAEKASEQTSAAQITVTFMNQDETLGSVSVNAGEVLDKSSYESFETVEGAEFAGWYETPSYLESSKKDLTTDTFTKDTTLFGDFKFAEIAEDTRHWYVAGTSKKGILELNNWAADLSDEDKAKFELVPTGNAVNEFSLTIDLYEGDQFQVIHDWSWDGQKGYGKFTDIDETQMENAGGLGGTDDTANVQVKMDGNYTITLTTNPSNQAQDTLSIVRNSDPVEAK